MGLHIDTAVYTVDELEQAAAAAMRGEAARMLKDITLGQFFPGNTFIHRLDPRTKLLAVILYIVALFNAQGRGDLRHRDGAAGRCASSSPGCPSGP